MNPCPGGHETYNFGRPFLGHRYYILSLSDLCMGVEKKIFIGHIATPCTRNLCTGGHESYNFGRAFLGDHFYIHGLSDLCMGVEKKIFKEIMHFYYITYIATP